MEQKIWYPFLRSSSTRLSPTISKLIAEEKLADRKINKLKSYRNKEELNKNLLIFKTVVLRHAMEEEKRLFPKVRQYVDRAELERIGKRLQTFKKRFNQAGVTKSAATRRKRNGRTLSTRVSKRNGSSLYSLFYR